MRTTEINILLWPIWPWFSVDRKIRGEKGQDRIWTFIHLDAWWHKMPKCQKVAKTLTLFSDSSTVDLSDILSCLWKVEWCCYCEVLGEFYLFFNISLNNQPWPPFRTSMGKGWWWGSEKMTELTVFIFQISVPEWLSPAGNGSWPVHVCCRATWTWASHSRAKLLHTSESEQDED